MIAYDSTLQAVTRPAQQDLLLLDGFLGRHLLGLSFVCSGGGEKNRAAKQALLLGRSSCR